MKYRIKFNYKQVGAIGIYQTDAITVEKPTEPTTDEIVDILHDTFPNRDHFCGIEVEPMKTVAEIVNQESGFDV